MKNHADGVRSLSVGEKLFSMALRSLPIKHGKHRILDRLSPKPWVHGVADVYLWYHGSELQIKIDDLVGWHFAMLRSFDPEVVELLCKTASRDTDHVFWDIGANKGACSYAISTGLPTAKIVAIEPQCGLKETNISNLEQICGGRYEYFQHGIGVREEELELVIPQDNAGKATLHAQGVHSGDRTEKIHIVTAQSIVELSDFGWPTLVKIDVEGHEAIVIESLYEALDRGICEAIVFENHFYEAENFQVIKKIADRAGYSIFGIMKSVFATKIVPANCVLDGVTDYVMVSENTSKHNAMFRKLKK